MTDPVSTQFAKAVETALKGIKKADGYHTNLGLSVHRGFWAHVVRAKDTVFPAVVIHPGVEMPGSVHGSGKKAMIRIDVPLVVAVGITYDATAYDELSACTADIRRALIGSRETLSQLGQGDTFDVGGTEPDLSTDSKYALAALAVGISIVETY